MPNNRSKLPTQIIHAQTKKIIVKELQIANTFFSRLKGLIGAPPLTYQQGLLISPCQQVHTHFMGFSIDVVFLDKEFKVLHIARQMLPWRFSRFIKNAHYVLELPVNGASFIKPDDHLILK